MEEGSQMSMNAFVKACEAYEANILMLKEKIGDLERKLAEQDMKIQAPIRNDNAFLLKLAAIRTCTERFDHGHCNLHIENVKKLMKNPKKLKITKDTGIDYKFLPVDTYDQVYINGNQIMFIDNELFNCKDNPFELLTHIRYLNIGNPKVGEILCNCLSKAKLVSGGFQNMLGNYYGLTDTYKVVKAHLSIHKTFFERVSLVLVLYTIPYDSQNPNRQTNTPALSCIIELDDLSNKEYIEKNFNVENLLE